MSTKFYLHSLVAFAVVLAMSSCKKNIPLPCDCSQDNLVASVSVFSSGLNNPRGLKFGPDGRLYVAEGGIGGTDTSGSLCSQVVPPVGPYSGSTNGARISRISQSGERSTFVDNLPSSQTTATQGGSVSGVGDIAFVGNTLYAVLAGAGCSHGVPSIPNGVVKINPDRSWKLIADLSAYQMANPVQNPFLGDFEPDGTWYSMVTADDKLYALEPNHGEIDRVSTHGNISRLIDISASQGHIVPTAMVFHNGSFYVGNLGVFPIAGNSSVYKISQDGSINIVATGFGPILGIDFDKTGAMYVLENTTGNPFPTPGTGDVVRIDGSGARKAIITGLNLPTAITFGPDDKLYISNWGFGQPPGGGEILRAEITCTKNQVSIKK